MPDFWRHSGYHLLDRRADGRLLVSDGLLRAYLRRPEIRPVEESCAAERVLHAQLLELPRLPVEAARIEALADPDARDNYRVLLGFRDRLLAADCLESAYIGIVRDPGHRVPPLFVDQLAQIILRAALEGLDDPFVARAGELFFRPQVVSVQDGQPLLADQETVEMHAATGGFGDLGRLLVEAQTPTRMVELDVMTTDNAATYWQRDERHDMVLNLSFGQPGLDALCRAMEAFLRQGLGIAASIQPAQRIRDERWVWHSGLDGESSAILNALYRGETVAEERTQRLLSLFRLDIADPSLMRADLAGRPVYLGLARDGRNLLRMKPQNLLVNLPLAARA
ncbi:MAG: DUF6352 family protein [Thalassobaculales bacterium]